MMVNSRVGRTGGGTALLLKSSKPKFSTITAIAYYFNEQILHAMDTG